MGEKCLFFPPSPLVLPLVKNLTVLLTVQARWLCPSDRIDFYIFPWSSKLVIVQRRRVDGGRRVEEEGVGRGGLKDKK